MARPLDITRNAAGLFAAVLAVSVISPNARAGQQVAQGDRSAASAPRITFSEHIAPIVFNHCASCHRPGESAPFSLTTYAEARPWGRQMATVTRTGQMPPWKASATDYPLKGARRLSAEQIDLIQRWVDAGMPQGDPSKQPPLPAFPKEWPLGQPDLIVSMPEAFPVPAEGRDVYRNFVLPLNLTEDAWVKAVDFRPSARKAVHHALFFVDNTGSARERDARDTLPGYDGGMGGIAAGGGGRGLLGGLLRGGNGARREGPGIGGLGGWVPGAQPRMLPDGLAFFVPKGADLIIATHFHASGRDEREASTIGVYLSKQPPTRAFAGIQLPPLFGVMSNIDIPAGEQARIEDSFVLPTDVRAFGVGGHAHYLARTMRLTATFPDQTTKTLLAIDDWDFGWQEQYMFDQYVDLPKGTRLDVAITYDNSAANRRNPSSPPKRVTWGEESTDEMGSMTLRVVAARESELPTLQRAVAEHVRRKAFESGLVQRMLTGRGTAAR